MAQAGMQDRPLDSGGGGVDGGRNIEFQTPLFATRSRQQQFSQSSIPQQAINGS